MKNYKDQLTGLAIKIQNILSTIDKKGSLKWN